MKNKGLDSPEIATMSNKVSVMANAQSGRASARHKILGSIMTLRTSHLLVNTWDALTGAMGRAASTVGRGSLIMASLVLAVTTMVPGAVFAAPVGAVGPSPNLVKC